MKPSGSVQGRPAVGAQFEWYFSGLRVAIVAAILSGVALGATDARAQGQRSESQSAQYVFVIDDSGSMSKEVRGRPAADPDRLAVFAVRSILSMLNPEDEATVVRLNGPAEGDAPPPLRRLSKNRSRLRRETSLDRTLAEYGGAETPCAEVLEAVKSKLKSSHRPGVPQVVMFLTDGACTGPEPEPSEFLEGLPSASEELLNFYLLRFSGRDYTESLERLAEETGGGSIEVSADDPTSILEPFARALSDSQGYRSYSVTPSDRKLAAHSAARRMRLLAVAPGEGDALSIGVEARRSGQGPSPISDSRRAGVHQYENGRTFRFASLDYEPGDVPVTVDVEGAGSDWRIVAVPEYRFFTETRIRQGECGAGGESIGSVEVGGTVCVEIQLINAQGEVVTGEAISGNTEAIVEYRGPGDDEPRELPANRVGTEAKYRLERVNVKEGSHVFDPVVRLATPGGGSRSVDIEGAARTLQASTLDVSARPSELAFGDLVPGGNEFHELDIEGNFPEAPARLTVRNRDSIPDCVQFRLNDVAEGEAQKLSAGGTHTVGVDVAPYCGPTAVDRRFESALRVEFADSATRSIPTLVVPVTFSLNSKVSIPDAVEVSLTGGEAVRQQLSVTGNFSREASFEAVVPPVGEREAWPGGDDLRLQFLDDEGEVVRDGSQPSTRTSVTFPAGGGQGVTLQLVADVCCSGGSYQTELALVPQEGEVEPIRIPVRVEVEAAGVAACWGQTILLALGVLLLILLGVYAYGMYRSTHLVDAEWMAGKLKPLVFDEYGSTQPADDRKKAKVREMVEEQFRENRWDRVVAWLKANPLKFGLPGESYHECIQFSVDQRRPEVWLEDVKGERDFRRRVDEDADKHTKLMFVQAQPGLEFFAVPGYQQQVAGFALERAGGGMGAEEGEVVKLRGDRLLRDIEGEAGEIAGWEIG